MKPKVKGGVGVLNLRLQNDTLLMKHMNKFYKLGSFWWKDVFRLYIIFRAITMCELGMAPLFASGRTYGQIKC